ncbi:hypothetical protein BBK36DRAFT_1136765 [Trichoderma citrinoviride]|uniref:Uncharacterized protein n=1 Tax=Trichoderma citrinoviride TaxID=58853 RepID=A0A2T4AWM7_9HYPO|nr:hypothetical protein BBK36DRAFT_1136765 [Trichoderma citrinoviride]PTB61453.1 hypothetical protein BBK36DRAFT_1136765 [Trichoderma citrinoviride]
MVTAVACYQTPSYSTSFTQKHSTTNPSSRSSLQNLVSKNKQHQQHPLIGSNKKDNPTPVPFKLVPSYYQIENPRIPLT